MSTSQPKALTVRLNKAALQRNALYSEDVYYCRIYLNDSSRGHSGRQTHDTPHRRLITGEVEWNCILVYTYNNERWLHIHLRGENADVSPGRGPQLPLTAKLDLRSVLEGPAEQFKGDLTLHDDTSSNVGSVNVECSFYPRPAITNSQSHTKRHKKTMASHVSSAHGGSNLLSPIQQAAGTPGRKTTEEAVSDAVSHTISRLSAARPGSHDGPSGPIMIEIGSSKAAFHDRIVVHPERPLFGGHMTPPPTQPSLWLEMAGEGLGTGGGSPSDSVSPYGAPSLWTDLAAGGGAIAHGNDPRMQSFQGAASPIRPFHSPSAGIQAPHHSPLKPDRYQYNPIARQLAPESVGVPAVRGYIETHQSFDSARKSSPNSPSSSSSPASSPRSPVVVSQPVSSHIIVNTSSGYTAPGTVGRSYAPHPTYPAASGGYSYAQQQPYLQNQMREGTFQASQATLGSTTSVASSGGAYNNYNQHYATVTAPQPSSSQAYMAGPQQRIAMNSAVYGSAYRNTSQGVDQSVYMNQSPGFVAPQRQGPLLTPSKQQDLAYRCGGYKPYKTCN